MGEKKILTEEELKSIPARLVQKYKKLGYIAYIDKDDKDKEIKWGTETQVLFDKMDRDPNASVAMPKFSFWLTMQSLYANFLWIILFFGLVIFTILLMHFDFNVNSMLRGIKNTIVEFMYTTSN